MSGEVLRFKLSTIPLSTGRGTLLLGSQCPGALWRGLSHEIIIWDRWVLGQVWVSPLLGDLGQGADLEHILTIGSGHLDAVLTSKPEKIDRKVGVVSGQVLSWAVYGESRCLAIFRNSHKISWRSWPDQRAWLFPVSVLLRWFVQKPVHSTPSSDLPSRSSFIVPLSWENFSSTLSCFPERYLCPSFHHCFKSCSPLSFLSESSLPLQPELLAMEKAVPCKAKVSYLLYLPRRWEDILHCKYRVHHRKGKKMTLYGPHCLSNTKLRATHILTHLTGLTVPWSSYFTPRKKRTKRLNAFSKVTVNGQAKKANPDSLGLESSLLHLATAFQTKQDMFLY